MPKSDLIETSGKVLEALGGGQYLIQTEKEEGKDGSEIRARLSGKLRKHHIRVLPGDDVTVAVSPYDLTHGMITYRGKPRPRR